MQVCDYTDVNADVNQGSAMAGQMDANALKLHVRLENRMDLSAQDAVQGELFSLGDSEEVSPQVAADDFVSLTMPVRVQSYVWDDQLPPVLQMNLPEGYLLQVLQEQFGPHIGASPIALLSVIGRNMVGRIQVAATGAELSQPAKPIEVAALLKGDNAEETFAELVRQHATSGVSGVVP